MREVFLPDLGENIEEATISYWHCQEGDQVEPGLDIVEVTTEKATFNVSAPCAGVIIECRTAEGTTVHSGDVLAVIQEGG